MKKIKLHILLCLILSFTNQLFAQTKVEVITKTIDRVIEYQKGFGVSIQGQGAQIIVRESPSNDIKVSMKFISKGLTKEIAEKELKYQKYVMDELNKTVVIRNYLLLPNNVELSTIQETVMEIFIPKGVELAISNAFGLIDLEGLMGRTDIESKYGDILIKDYKGECGIKGNYGDFKGSNLKGKLYIDTDHVEIELTSITGHLKVNSNLGNVLIKESYQMQKLLIRGEKSDINLGIDEPGSYRWDIRSKYGEFNVPEIITNSDIDKNETKILSGNVNLPSIELSTDFGDVTINEQ